MEIGKGKVGSGRRKEREGGRVSFGELLEEGCSFVGRVLEAFFFFYLVRREDRREGVNVLLKGSKGG